MSLQQGSQGELEPAGNEEIVLNLWYVYANDGLIYSLRIKPCLAQGTDDEKLKFLRDRSLVDWEVADPYPIPSSHRTVIGTTEVPVVPLMAFPYHVPTIGLFEEAIKMVESRMPAQTRRAIPEDPLVCITGLLGDDSGRIRLPKITGQIHIK